MSPRRAMRPVSSVFTSSSAPAASGSRSRPFSLNTVLRGTTRSFGIAARLLIRLSVIPSLKYAASAESSSVVNGSTASDRPRARDARARGVAWRRVQREPSAAPDADPERRARDATDPDDDEERAACASPAMYAAATSPGDGVVGVGGALACLPGVTKPVSESSASRAIADIARGLEAVGGLLFEAVIHDALEFERHVTIGTRTRSARAARRAAARPAYPRPSALRTRGGRRPFHRARSRAKRCRPRDRRHHP